MRSLVWLLMFAGVALAFPDKPRSPPTILASYGAPSGASVVRPRTAPRRKSIIVNFVRRKRPQVRENVIGDSAVLRNVVEPTVVSAVSPVAAVPGGSYDVTNSANAVALKDTTIEGTREQSIIEQIVGSVINGGGLAYSNINGGSQLQDSSSEEVTQFLRGGFNDDEAEPAEEEVQLRAQEEAEGQAEEEEDDEEAQAEEEEQIRVAEVRQEEEEQVSLRQLDDSDEEGISLRSQSLYQRRRCGLSEVLNLNGECVTPSVRRNVYAFTLPVQKARPSPKRPVPNPKVEYNIIFLKSQQNALQEKIFVPPPQQKTVVYVLNERETPSEPEFIEAPSVEPTEPDVFFVNYNEGDNPELPGGIRLQDVLNQDPSNSDGDDSDEGSDNDRVRISAPSGVRARGSPETKTVMRGYN